MARELGVSPGNLYNYVEGKNALFFLALRHALGDPPQDDGVRLPLVEMDLALTAGWAAERLDFVTDYPHLERVFSGEPFRPGEVERIVGELHDVLARMRLGVDMIERSVRDVAGLGDVFGRVRTELFARYERYL